MHYYIKKEKQIIHTHTQQLITSSVSYREREKHPKPELHLTAYQVKQFCSSLKLYTHTHTHTMYIHVSHIHHIIHMSYHTNLLHWIIHVIQ